MVRPCLKPQGDTWDISCEQHWVFSSPDRFHVLFRMQHPLCRWLGTSGSLFFFLSFVGLRVLGRKKKRGNIS